MTNLVPNICFIIACMLVSVSSVHVFSLESLLGCFHSFEVIAMIALGIILQI